MAQIYRTVVGNNSPDLVFTVKRNGVAIDLSSASNVKLAIQREHSGDTTNAANQTCAITTAASGIVTYTPVNTDFPIEGRYIGDVYITYIGGKIEHLAEVLLIIARGAIS